MTRDTPSKATRHFFFRLETREVGSEPLHTCNFYALLLRQQQGTKKRKTVQPTYSPPFGVSAWVTLRPFFALIVCSALFFCFNWFSSFAPSPSLCVCACVSARTLTCICFFFCLPLFSLLSLSLFLIVVYFMVLALAIFSLAPNLSSHAHSRWSVYLRVCTSTACGSQ